MKVADSGEVMYPHLSLAFFCYRDRKDQRPYRSLVNILGKPYFEKMIKSSIFELLNDDVVKHRESHQTLLNSRLNLICLLRYAVMRMLPSLSSLLLNFLTLSVSIPAPAPDTDILSLLNANSSNSTTTSDEHDHWSITAPFNLDRC